VDSEQRRGLELKGDRIVEDAGHVVAALEEGVTAIAPPLAP